MMSNYLASARGPNTSLPGISESGLMLHLSSKGRRRAGNCIRASWSCNEQSPMSPNVNLLTFFDKLLYYWFHCFKALSTSKRHTKISKLETLHICLPYHQPLVCFFPPMSFDETWPEAQRKQSLEAEKDFYVPTGKKHLIIKTLW